MALAIFDLDHTLLSDDSDHAWGQYLADRELVDPAVHQHRNDHFYEQYKAGTLDIHAYLRFALQPLLDYPLQHMLAERERFLAERIEPLISQKSRDLIQKHRDQGDHLLIITATNGFITYPIAERLGIADIIAPHPEVIDGQYTGEIVGVPSFQDGKVTRLNAWLEEHQQSMDGAWFYSDSRNDLPLLRLVDHPVAVNPDSTLEAEARQYGWPIISLRDD
ncbi:MULTISPECIES: HAD family phosphatase [unclassified Oceanobacter]|uniref:histidinol-phosphatase n=2 Tax=Gammaproteobacteria TaxID=1236 RepID=UPI0026E45508|nr:MULTISPECIES: HAD family hydrolase [unclassified Oceanobacter]MDO6680786.1 HAD family hydrolase [Oceanobacter sp. 5_MG-2023]MDP2504555.1 HAD family hydrolase [Oceanobacter sp. 3_MG-2023]MDP2546992.1 HAD family hydrolase [Oceanobacter sp. 4_MG-2023]MDP2607816.1 HAD family hydrolase [Oceanobacter sp. 1_MG-2023]MDP2611000.1 HAD family hydrolase [Oceanobacter sp. 2_MG-2023]